MKDIPPKEEKLGLESSLTPHCSKISNSKKNIVHHVLIGNKNPINFGRNDFPPSCPRPATKRVSRLHCQISWSSSKEIYHLKVTGANGLKCCGNFYGPGDFLNITSGTIIDFVGLKVLFLDSESSETVKQYHISPNYETASIPLSSCPLITHESQNFAESAHEDSTLGNISFALENSYEVLKSSNELCPKKKLSQNNSELSLEKKNFGADEDFELEENGKTNQILTEDLLSCLDESEDAKLPRKKKQKRALEASSPKASNKDKYFKKGDSFDKADFSEESSKQSVKASSGAQSEDELSDEPTPVIEMLDKDTAQPDDEMFIDLVLQTLVGMGKRTPVALKPLLDELLRVQHNSELTPEYLAFRLAQFPMFIKVPALGPFPEVKNDQYYYSPELDWNPSRKVEIGTLVRKPRGCTLSSKQYYFKPLPKLPKYKGPGYKKTQ